MALASTRRGFIKGLIAFAAAPAIVRAESLMPIKVMKPLPFFEMANETWAAHDVVFKATAYGGPFRTVILYDQKGSGDPLSRIDLEKEFGHAITLFPEETFTLGDVIAPSSAAIRLE